MSCLDLPGPLAGFWEGEDYSCGFRVLVRKKTLPIFGTSQMTGCIREGETVGSLKQASVILGVLSSSLCLSSVNGPSQLGLPGSLDVSGKMKAFGSGGPTVFRALKHHRRPRRSCTTESSWQDTV